MVLGTTFVLVFVPASAVVGILFALTQWFIVSKIQVGAGRVSNNGYMHVDEDGVDDSEVNAKCAEIQAAISEGGLFSSILHVNVIQFLLRFLCCQCMYRCLVSQENLL